MKNKKHFSGLAVAAVAFCIGIAAGSNVGLAQQSASAGTQGAEAAGAEGVRVGNRDMPTAGTTNKGTPVVHMWGSAMAKEDRRRGAGFPVLKTAQHADVWSPPTREDGAYNHYACLINYEGRFFAMWGNHPLGEDGPGQRVLYSYSDRWGKWSEPKELFEAPGPVKPRTESGIHLKPDRWIVIDDVLYAVVYVHGAGIYPVARAVHYDGTLGEPFYMAFPRASARELSAFLPERPTELSSTAEALRAWYPANDKVSWWGRSGEGVPSRAVDDATVIESLSYRAADGNLVLLVRNWGTPSNPVHNNRIYVSFSDRTDQWGSPYPTNIPDSPSRAYTVTLSNGTVLLIGNQNVPHFDEALYLNRDPLTVSISRDGYLFDNVAALRTDAKTRFTYPGVRGRNHGFGYPSSIVHDGWLYTLYSISKEDMGITRVRLSDMGLSE